MVMDNMVEKVGRALGEAETNKILSLYGSIVNSDLAGGAPITDFIKMEVKMALYKLGKVKNGKNKCMLVAAFYPFCNSERKAEEWDTHLGRIYKFCDAFLQSYELEEEKISLGEWKAKIYFIWC